MTSPSPRKSVTNRMWLIRGGVAIVLGLVIGAAAGVAGVKRIDPGRPGQPDSLQVMLDSLRRVASTSPREQRRAADSTDAAQRESRVADSIAIANDPDSPIIPDVVNLEEGAARTSIEGVGLTVGTVQFRASAAAAGVVLATVPAGGRRVRSGTAINLILSDGRTPPPATVDTPSVAGVFPRLP